MPLHHFDKYEIYANSIKDAKFTFLIQKLDSKFWSIYHMDLDEIHIQYGIEGSGYIASGYTRPDGWFFFLLQSEKPVRVNGQKLTKESVFVVPPGYTFHVSTKASHEWFSIFIPNNILDIQFNKSSIVHKSDHVVSLSQKQVNYFQKRVQRHLLRSKSTITSDRISILLFREFIINSAKHIIFNLRIKNKFQGRTKLDRKIIISKALSTIKTTELIHLNIEKLASDVDVSERTLRASFHEYFGISPLKYIQLLRLYKARDMIHDSGNIDKTIVFISTSLGFWDQGRFAKRYHLVFGELPSHAHIRIKKRFRKLRVNQLSIDKGTT